MGFFRLYITLLIVVGHLHTWWGFSFPWLDIVRSGGLVGIARVHVFFLQSGFLTQLQFKSGTPGRAEVLGYWGKRLRQIYPQYLMFMLLTAGAYWLVGDSRYLQAIQYKNMGTGEMVFSNLLGINLPTLRLWHPDMALASGYLLLPQAWSLTIQLGFILLTPFVLPSKWRVTGMAALCAASMVYFYAFTAVQRNFFVTELGYFWFGALVARRVADIRFSRTPLIGMVAVFIIPCAVMAVYYPLAEAAWGVWPVFVLFNLLLAATMVPCYQLCQGMVVDRYLSRVSFTLYLCHTLIAVGVTALKLDPTLGGALTVLAALGLAVVVNLGWLRRRVL